MRERDRKRQRHRERDRNRERQTETVRDRDLLGEALRGTGREGWAFALHRAQKSR